MAVRLSALRAGRPLPPRRFLVLISVRVDPRAIVRLEVLRQFKNTITTSEIETATFRLVTYCLNIPDICANIRKCVNVDITKSF
jgi:hypothetical protein